MFSNLLNYLINSFSDINTFCKHTSTYQIFTYLRLYGIEASFIKTDGIKRILTKMFFEYLNGIIYWLARGFFNLTATMFKLLLMLQNY